VNYEVVPIIMEKKKKLKKTTGGPTGLESKQAPIASCVLLCPAVPVQPNKSIIVG